MPILAFDDAATLAKTLKSAKPDLVAGILETLATLGQARALAAGRYVAARAHTHVGVAAVTERAAR